LNVIVPPLTLPFTPASVAVVNVPKPVPVTVTVAEPDATGMSPGLTLFTTGGGFELALTVKGSDWVVPPPGEGFVTLTFFVPAVISLAGIVTDIPVCDTDCGE